MHFWVSATRAGFHDGFCCPRKIGTNWFMPALVKRRLGASGKSDDDGTMVCFFSRKKSRKDCRIWAEVMMSIFCGSPQFPKRARISKWKCSPLTVIVVRRGDDVVNA